MLHVVVLVEVGPANHTKLLNYAVYIPILGTMLYVPQYLQVLLSHLTPLYYLESRKCIIRHTVLLLKFGPSNYSEPFIENSL